MLMARLKKQIGLAFDRELLDWLDTWIAKQKFPPTRTAVLEALVREMRKREDADG